ncbi:hypothetical protein HBH98_199060 [Parastagonospora nodorum]|nr:hypothetical protein HBH53_238820 [Parastagonospora nodorum]KAH4042980.1 hypothetical protein HBH49_240190 [Parastagonospora nodorum]KAH4184173.1 hypothetical protein HBH42_192670 [Parastagonospora nodorum]KAH4339822.1 hypothetical protein HBH98_199060 [Parastagonospora nodorum]KAH4371380.1 hypothetical protein HBH99_235660 [Parastagonospora nodorum]
MRHLFDVCCMQNQLALGCENRRMLALLRFRKRGTRGLNDWDASLRHCSATTSNPGLNDTLAREQSRRLAIKSGFALGAKRRYGVKRASRLQRGDNTDKARKEHQEVPSLAYRECGRVHRLTLAKLPPDQLPHTAQASRSSTCAAASTIGCSCGVNARGSRVDLTSRGECGRMCGRRGSFSATR